MQDLIPYLEKNNFFPRKEDIEAILRRCDHDANRMISYAEFCELTAVQEPDAQEYDEQMETPGEDANAYVDSGTFNDTFNDRVEELDQTDALRQS